MSLTLRGAFCRMAAITLVAASTSAWSADAVYMGWSQTEVGLRPTMDKLFGSIRSANPDKKLEVVGFPFGQMEQNLILRRRNNERIDVAQLQERWVPQFAGMKALYDLNQVVGAENLASRYDPDLLKLGQVNGRQVAVPFTAGAVTLVANKNVLSAAGITTPPRTLEEFKDALRKVKASNKDLIPFGLSTKGTALIQTESTIWFWAHGARFLDKDGKVLVDSPQARAALRDLADMVKEGLIVKGNDRFDTRKLYAADKVAFFFDPPVIRGFVRAQSPGSEAQADAKIMILPVPTAKTGDTPRPMLWAHFLAMFNHGGATGKGDSFGAKVLAAVGMDADTQSTLWREAGQLPTLKASLVDAQKDPYARAYLEAAKTALWDETTQFANGAELRQIIGEEIEAGMLGAKSADDAIQSMARRLNRSMKDVR